MERSVGRERGIGMYEAALWLVALLPVGLAGGSILAVVNDQMHISGVPAAVLRESSPPGLRWLPDGAGGRFDADVDGLRAQIGRMAQAAVAEAERGVVKARAVSAKACFWIFSVNSSTGSLESPIGSECDARGPLGGDLSMSSDLEYERRKVRGIPFGGQAGFADKVVVTGVIVGAVIGGAGESRLLDPRITYPFSKSAITFARQEVVL
ncbi:MAG: hypothetical protein RL518_1731 [Pseudomonadota bacterium]|jgi:hypothetical protein